MKKLLILTALFSALCFGPALHAWSPVTFSAGSVANGYTGSVDISISGDSVEDYTVALRNTSTGDVAFFQAYTGWTAWGYDVALDDYYYSGVSGSISGSFASWTWSVTGLPPGNYEIEYDVTYMGNPYGTPNPYASVSGTVSY